jgi:hypothetical protein
VSSGNGERRVDSWLSTFSEPVKALGGQPWILTFTRTLSHGMYGTIRY